MGFRDTDRTRWIERDQAGKIIADYANRQPGRAEEEVLETDPALVAFRGGLAAAEALARRRGAYAAESDPLGMEALAELLKDSTDPKAQAYLAKRAEVKARYSQQQAAPRKG